MLRHTPKLPYKGLTIVLSNPSRFDRSELISSTGGWFFNKECLAPHLNKYQCDIRLAEDRSAFLPNTKAVLLLGGKALKLWTGLDSLQEIRGTPLRLGDVSAIASFIPQDCCDTVDYESRLNPLAQHDDDDPYEDEDEEGNEKRHGRTKRSNYRFWLKKDTHKLINILEHGVPDSPSVNYHIYPDIDEVLKVLRTTKGKSFYIDIETDPVLNIKCIGFSFGLPDVYVVPFITHEYKPAYAGLASLFATIAIASRDNETVAHNGAQFDFLVLMAKYGIPMGRKLYDTMIAQHRCYPLVEKSLAHGISLWTHEPFHKDEAGSHNHYRTHDDMMRLMKYCGKDIFTMILLKSAIDAYAISVPGLTASIAQANASIRPYLTTTLFGIRFDEEKRQAIIANNDRLATQYIRIMRVLTGPTIKPLISNKTCCAYFHDALDYKAVARSKKTKKPNLGETSLLKLKLKNDNPVIDLLIAYRGKIKESGSLKFTPLPEELKSLGL